MEVKEISKDKNVIIREYLFGKEDIMRLEDKAVAELNRKNYHIEGFRPGRVPKEVYKLRLKDAFYEIYVADEAIKEVEKELDKEEFQLLLPPVIADANFTAEGGKVVVELHTEPVVKFDPTKLKLRKAKEDEVLDGYVDMRIKYVIEENAVLEPKDGEAEEGDLVKVKETVMLGEKKLRDAEEREYVLLKDDEREVVKQLYGKKKGDVVEFERAFEKGDDKIVYKYVLEVEEVYKRILPEFTDEFVKSLAIENIETTEQLKDKFRTEGKEIYDRELAESYRAQIIDQISEISEIEISEKTIERAVENIIDNLKEDGKYDSYVQNYGSEEKLVEELKNYYLNMIKKDLVVKKIAEENDIKVDAEDIKTYAERVSVEWGVSPDRAEAIIKSRQDIRNEVVMEIVESKVAKILAQQAQIEEVSFKEQEKQNEETKEQRE
ncbi:trigger factor [Fervidobacterium changbaicum]|uniref:Trigger factor n=2 Tax=Fervidobacterium TaxID=2422 RepID=A0AAI8CMC4_FERIS|nr:MULTISPECIES: trigger factor [Fervidobacterium]AMW33010.1 trigger factor [Fervidobacterium islandicum]QAV33054.1 trigger factor [Fervidobacterium changbaicum]SDH02580.1 trigger factor [Fervidobacterium changbaicum]